MVDEIIAALLPRYAQALDANRNKAASVTTAAAATARPVDSTIVGTWTGTVRTAERAVPIRFSIGKMGDVQATIGTYADTGRARLTASGMFRVHIPTATLQGPAWYGALPLDFYLVRMDDRFGGTTTTMFRDGPIEGRVSYYAEIRRP